MNIIIIPEKSKKILNIDALSCKWLHKNKVGIIITNEQINDYLIYDKNAHFIGVFNNINSLSEYTIQEYNDKHHLIIFEYDFRKAYNMVKAHQIIREINTKELLK